MDKIYYNLDGEILTINYPTDESGHYCVETDRDVELGHLFIADPEQASAESTWKGTTPELNAIAEELGKFIEEAEL
jgi:hypothetical protein